MERTIVGRFQSKHNADAVAALIARYIDTAEICISPGNAPNRHGAIVLAGGEDKDPGAQGAISVHHGQVVALAAAGINAYSGPLVGAMAAQGVHDDKPTSQDRRPDGVTLSVRITNPVSEGRVIATLRAAGAADIEPDHAEWRDGDWANFNSVAAPRLAARQLH